MSPSANIPEDVLAALEHSRELLECGDGQAALQCLRTAYEANPGHPQLRSYYGLCLGLEDRRYHEAIELCQSAVQQEFFNPELYLNVARLNLAFGFRAEGMRFLRRAAMIDPGSAGVRALQCDLGMRSPPIVPFLPRRHFVNRWLGSLRFRLTGRGNGSRKHDEGDGATALGALRPRGSVR
jgi:tetratricopeptide (TPR) repeat protein